MLADVGGARVGKATEVGVHSGGNVGKALAGVAVWVAVGRAGKSVGSTFSTGVAGRGQSATNKVRPPAPNVNNKNSTVKAFQRP